LGEANEKLDRYYIGIGIELHKEIYRGNEAVIVDDVFPESPAEKAGVRAGDIILEVDRQPTSDLKISDVIKRVGGVEEGSEVHLKIWRVILQENPIEFEVTVIRARLDKAASVPLGRPLTGSMSFHGGRVEFSFKVEEIKKKGTFRYTYRFKNVSKQEIYFECDVLGFALGNNVMRGTPIRIYPIFFKAGEVISFVLETADFP
jgi:hypothetical protein